MTSVPESVEGILSQLFDEGDVSPLAGNRKECIARAVSRLEALAALAQPKEEGGQTVDVAGPQSGGEVAPSSGTNIPDWLFRLDHVFEAVVRDLRAGLREAAHEIMRLETLVANPPLAPDRRDVLRFIEKHYHETDAMADALLGLFRSRAESVAQRDGAARVQITPPQSNGLNPDLSSPLAKEAEGWKLVPVEPDKAMLRAALNLEVAPDEPITDYLRTPGNSDEDRKIWEAVVPGIVSEAVFFHPSYSHREFMEAVLRQAYRAMIEAASPTPQGEGRRS